MQQDQQARIFSIPAQNDLDGYRHVKQALQGWSGSGAWTTTGAALPRSA